MSNIFHNISSAACGVSLVLSVLAFESSNRSAVAQSATIEQTVKAQLYLVVALGGSFKKGYQDAGKPPLLDGRVYFRECGAEESIPVEAVKLTPISGKCSALPTWPGFIGKVMNVNPDGTVQIKTDEQKVLHLTAEDWAKGFTSVGWENDKLPPPPKVGELIGGLDQKDPKFLYVIQNTPFKKDIRG